MVAFGGRRLNRRNVALAIDQGAKDDDALSLASSDVTHALTSRAPTNTYLTAGKFSAAFGGALFDAIGEDDVNANVLSFRAFGGTANTAKTTGAFALIEVDAREHDGAGTEANITADGNVFAVRAFVGGSGLIRFLVDEDGDIYSVTAGQTFDQEDDIALVDAYDRVRSGRGTAAERAELVRLKILGEAVPDEDGNPTEPLTNESQLTNLITGTLRQQDAKIAAIEQRLAALP